MTESQAMETAKPLNVFPLNLFVYRVNVEKDIDSHEKVKNLLISINKVSQQTGGEFKPRVK